MSDKDEGPGTAAGPGAAEGMGAGTRLLRVDLHAHTDRSPDASLPPAELVERAVEAGIDRIAVTDHGAIEGALLASETAPGRVIVGQEVRCACRTELIGLFLEERIPERRPFEEVVDRIRDQGGVVYAPHPYAYAWRPLRRARRALSVADVVEAFNARAFLPPWNRAAARAAARLGLPVGAGSDAHFAPEVGRAYTLMPPFGDREGFLRAARRARPVGCELTGPLAHARSTGLKLGRRLSERPLVGSPGLLRPRAAER